jgi:type II secretory pathway component PulJ
MMRPLRQLARDERGVTLSEMLVVIVFMGLLSAAFSLTLSSTIRHSSEIEKQSDLQTDVRAALDPMTRELRQAYSGTSVSPVESIAATGTPQITFTTPDRACVGASCLFRLRRVSYRLTGGTLQRAEYTSTNDSSSASWSWPSGSPPSAWSTLVTGVTTASPFTFLDANGATTTTAGSVRTVKTSITATTAAGAGHTLTYSTSASLRTTQ